MSWRADVPGASAGPSYEQTEAYETGKGLGQVDRSLNWPYEPFMDSTPEDLAALGEAWVRAYVAGYQDGYAQPDTECRCTGDDGCLEHLADDPQTGDTRDEQHHERSQHVRPTEEVEPL